MLALLVSPATGRVLAVVPDPTGVEAVVALLENSSFPTPSSAGRRRAPVHLVDRSPVGSPKLGGYRNDTT